MRHLYQSIYLTIIASLVAVVIVAGAMWRFGSARGPMGQGAELAAEFAAAALPDTALPALEQQRAIRALAQRLRADLTLFDHTGQPIAVVGRPGPVPRPRDEPLGIVHDAAGPAWSLQLPDGRWLVARLPPGRHNPFVGLVLFLAAIASIIALCAYPVVRGLTRRIERLQRGVDQLGSGDLRARVEVEGKDEVARLARGFNIAAERIESLVGAHRMLLANASHELRTPLARLRIGLELLKETGDAKYSLAAQQDLRELDQLIEEILLTSRLDAGAGPRELESVDLLALAAEECAQYSEAELSGEPVSARGDARLLRRLIRNLLENARRHGKPPTVIVVRPQGARALIEVSDAGPGIPIGDRERVFEPFQQLAGDKGGSGLGLAIVRRIARLHGGDARIVDAAGGGARFEIELANGSPA